MIGPLQSDIQPGTDLLSWALGEIATAFGGPEVFGLLGGSVLLLAFYLASDGGLATPATLTVLTGGLLIGALPAGYQSMALVVIFIGIVGALLAGFEKYSATGI